jgi:tetratricopeptide (TPR) repeat protein
MESLAAEGNFAAATAYFESYRARLLREYEVDPSEELMELADSLAARAESAQAERPTRRGQPDHAESPRPSAPLPAGASLTEEAPAAWRGDRTPTIAILRSTTVPGADRLEQLTQAFNFDLISTLCRFKEWTVVTSGSEPMMFETGVRDSVADLASMSIDYALLTSISDVAGSTVINVRLTDCRSRSVLISDQYPAISDNWPSVFNDICCRVASRTQVSIAAARLRNVAGRSPEQRQAYDVWLEGEVLSRLWTPDGEDRAVALFQKALELDDQLACAYGSWAAALHTRWITSPGWPEDEADRLRAYELAKRAVTLDPLDCRNHMHLGWCHLLARRFEPGELHFQMAHDLNPSNPDNLLVCGLASAFCGQHDNAKALCDRAAHLNPFRPMHYWGYRASVELLGRNFAACIAAVSRAPDMYPDIQGWAAVAHAHLGHLAEARAALQQFYADMRRRWAGAGRPTEQALRTWFAEVFPIKLEEDRRLISEGLERIG